MMNSMDMEKKSGQMDPVIKDSIIRERSMARAEFNLLTRLSMREN